MPWVNPQSEVRPLGLAADTLYRHLLRSAPATLADHASALGWGREHAEGALETLVELRLVRRGRRRQDPVVVDDPRAGIGRVLDQREADLDARRRSLLALREALESYELDYRAGLQNAGQQLPPLEVIPPADHAAVVDHLSRSSTGEVLQLSLGRSIGGGLDAPDRPGFAEVVASGRGVRTIFPMTVLSTPEGYAFCHRRAEAGEQQRFLPEDAVHVEFALWRGGAVLLDSPRDTDLVLLRSESVLEAFTFLFEGLWGRAQPFAFEDRTDDRDGRLLELMGMGLKDEAIARQTGMSLRTVRRRVSALMDAHGVETRFQLGLAVGAGGPQRPTTSFHSVE